jgi:hypothetical protein
VYIAQDPTQLIQGFISSINYTTGHFTVGFAAGTIECVINDPYGAYGLPYLDHPLWTADPQNPSIHATNGFPMCIPRVDPSASGGKGDPLCPNKNRPVDLGTGNPATIM